jgi:hypothetical protein
MSFPASHTTKVQAPDCAVPDRAMLVELDTRHNDGLTVRLEWDRDTGETRIVLHDERAQSITAFVVPPVDAADAFRHPFRYAP